ncbi:vasotab [Musca domestica]|uniref:Vasotab n=1 Tax=Musca domestica TaxID=7370 RepID=A0A1I8MPT5_MUSDO|nr:vasotab [Musca domestica]
MKFVASIALAILALLLAVAIGEARTCQRPCTREYRPVCGTLKGRGGVIARCTFGNLCTYEVNKCLSRLPWTHKKGACQTQTNNCKDIVRQ